LWRFELGYEGRGRKERTGEESRREEKGQEEKRRH